MRNRLIKVLLMIMMVISIFPCMSRTAYAEDNPQYTLSIEANGKQIIGKISLPYTFESGGVEVGDLDEIIKKLYGQADFSYNEAPTVSGGSGKVTAGVYDEGGQYIIIEGPFDGQATVTGQYFAYDAGNYILFTYSLVFSFVTEYPLWVGGVQVTSANKENILNDTGTATASFDQSTNTLTLNGATIENGYDPDDSGEKSGIYYNGSEKLNIVSSSDTVNKIGSENRNLAKGINSSGDAVLTVSGNGALEAYGSISGIDVHNDLKIESGNVKAGGGSYGLFAGGTITISGGTVSADAHDEDAQGSNNHALYGSKGVSIISGNVTATANGNNASGIASGEGTISIIGGKVSSSGTDDTAGVDSKIAYGIKTAENGIIEIGESADVSASGTTAALYDKTKNAVAGMGWADKEGTSGRTAIPVNSEAQTLNYKKVEFVSGPVVEYPLWVGGVQVTSANRYAIPGTDKGQASYDPDTKTLTLNDAIITGVHPYDGENRRASIFASGIDLRIAVEGENSVGKNDTYEGIRVQGPDNSSRNSLTITGEGKLDITAEMYGIIVNGHLTLNEANSACTVNATTGRNRAIYSTGRITVNGGTVKAVSNHLDAICCMEGMSIVSGSKVTAIAEGNYGIDANPGKIIIAENVDLIASGTKEALRTGKDNYVINLLAGTGWTNSEGSGSGHMIPISVRGQKLDDYKKVQFPAVRYTVSVDDSITNGTVTSDLTDAMQGQTITLSAVPAQRYELSEISGKALGVPNTVADLIAAFGNAEFTFDYGNYTISASNDSFVLKNKKRETEDTIKAFATLTKTEDYAYRCTSDNGGTYYFAVNSEGKITKITVYQSISGLSGATFFGESDKTVNGNIDLKQDATNENKYIFTMPAGNVTVSAKFEQIDAEHIHDGISFSKWKNRTSLPSAAGNYYLAGDVTLSDTAWTVPEGITNLCLNGHKITQTVSGENTIYIGENATLNLYNAEETTGKITHASGKAGKGVWIDGGSFNMYGGEISGNESADYIECYGGGVYVGMGTFTLENGTISNNTAEYGGGVALNDMTHAVFNMKGGTISDNKAKGGGGVFADNGEFNMTDGTISKNIANVNFGGGVYIATGSFAMSGGTISENEAEEGGGVYSGDKFTMSGGTISKNDAVEGGGVFVEVGTFEMSGGTISGNTAADGGGIFNESDVIMTGGTISKNDAGEGGGVYVEAGGTLTMSDEAVIEENTCDSEGGGVYAFGEVIMNGGTISKNAAETRGGGIAVDGDGAVEINDGSIADNTAGISGGGVYSWTILDISGGSITGNNAKGADPDDGGGGVYLEGGTFNLSGSAVIKDNLNNSETDNVYLTDGNKLSVTGSLADTAKIGVTMETAGIFTDSTTSFKAKDYLDRFTSDSAEYMVEVEGDELKLNQLVTYPLFVSSIQVTSANKDDVTGDNSVSYDPDTKTLSLNNYSYTGDGYENSGICIKDKTNSRYTISLKGDNSITMNDSSDRSYGIDTSGDLLIKGDGSSTLKIQSGKVPSETASSVQSIGINARTVSFDGVKADITGGQDNTYSCGIAVEPFLEGSITLIDSEISSQGCYGIYGHSRLSIDADSSLVSCGRIAQGPGYYAADDQNCHLNMPEDYAVYFGNDADSAISYGDNEKLLKDTDTYRYMKIAQGPAMTTYNVEHYQQDPEGDGYTLKDTDKIEETSGKSVTAQPKTYDHFSFDENNRNNVKTGVVKEDGSLTLKLYYSRETFTVIFKDHDDTVLQTSKMRYESKPVYNSTEPTRGDTERYIYTFDGWYDGEKKLDEQTKVTGDVTFKARYIEQPRTYKVTFIDDNGTILQSEDLEYGAKPLYKGDEPAKAADVQYTYSFTGWDPVIDEQTTVKDDVTYKATYSKTLNKYKISFVDDDGTSIKVDGKDYIEYDYGTAPSAIRKPTVSSKTIGEKTYSFAGWDPAIKEVKGDQTYTATYVESTITYNVIWLNNDEETVIHAQENKITMTRINEIMADIESKWDHNPAEADEHYNYVFLNWNTRESGEGEDKVINYIATFSLRPKSYQITWKDGSGNTLKKETAAYQATPVYSGPVPTKYPDVENIYELDKTHPWGYGNPHPTNGDTTYTAKFNAVKRRYRISFLDEDKTVLETYELEYGTKLKGKGPSPTKDADKQYTYTFTGWDPAIDEQTTVTSDATYQALYSKQLRQYEIRWVDDDGTLLDKTKAAYGSTPDHDGLKDKVTPQYTYTFKNWDPVPVPVTAEATYKAVYEKTINKYKISFIDHSGTIKEIEADYGTAIKDIRPEDPAGYEDPKAIYSFLRWDPEISMVKGDQVFTAVYDSQIKRYRISFDINGAESDPIADQLIEYDGSIRRPADPSRSGKDFAGWFINDVKWDFNTRIKGELTLKAQWIERSHEETINGVKVSVATDDLQGQSANNRYNDKPLLIIAGNGVIVIPAGLKATVSVPRFQNSYAMIDLTKTDISDRQRSYVWHLSGCRKERYP